MNLKFILNVLSCAFLSIGAARADLEIIPESRHHQYTTFGLFIEDGDSSLLLRNAARAWGAVGGALALASIEQWASKPQLIFHGSANASFRLNERHDTLLTETIDARVGLSFEFQINDESRWLVGWTHQSGHISDNVDDPSLIGPNLGNELIQVRYVRDIGQHARLGASFKPIIGSEPKMKFFGANQFAEWFPLGSSADFRKPTWFVATGLEQYGTEAVHLSVNTQIGAYIGSHLGKEHHSLMRLVLGYYNGVDPRMKYAQYKLQTMQFGYIGLFFSI